MSAPVDLRAMFAQLEAAEAFDAENRDLIALAARIEKFLMPTLFSSAAVLTAPCLVSQAMKWITL